MQNGDSLQANSDSIFIGAKYGWNKHTAKERIAKEHITYVFLFVAEYTIYIPLRP